MFSTTVITVMAVVGAILAAISAFVSHKATKAVMQPKIDAANNATEKVVVDSQVADAQVKQAAADKSAQVEAIIKNIDARVDAMPEGSAADELDKKYGADK